MRYSGYSFWGLILSKKENFLTIQNFEPGVHFRVIRGLSTQNREITARFKFFDRFNQWDDRVEHSSKESKRISQPKKSVKMTILGIFLLKIEWKKCFRLEIFDKFYLENVLFVLLRDLSGRKLWTGRFFHDFGCPFRDEPRVTAKCPPGPKFWIVKKFSFFVRINLQKNFPNISFLKKSW